MAAKKRTNDEWRALLAKQRASGQTQEEWCAANGINLYTLRDRASRLKRLDMELEQEEKQPEKISANWMEVRRIPEEGTDIHIEYGGFSIRVTAGFDPGLLTEVLRAVSLVCC